MDTHINDNIMWVILSKRKCNQGIGNIINKQPSALETKQVSNFSQNLRPLHAVGKRLELCKIAKSISLDIS